MIYSLEIADNFVKESKKLIKKYGSLKQELTVLFKELEKNPTKGIPLGNDVYKIRVAISSKNKGKSGGARIITCVKVIQHTVYLVSIYSKGEQNSISDKEINEILVSEKII